MAPLFIEKFGLFFKVLGWGTIKVTPVIIAAVFFKFPVAVLKFLGLHTLDLGRFLGNLTFPQKKKGAVVAPGVEGYGGEWPPFIAPGKNDLRSPCPYLNAMANHGIINRDGRDIELSKLGKAMVNTLNFSPTLVKDTINSVEKLYGRDHIHLSDLAAHNIVEHDASLIRHDARFVENQTTPAHDLINDMLDMATGPKSEEHPEGYLTPGDLSRCLSLRQARSKRDNTEYYVDFLHQFFGASNASLMYETVAGDVKKLRTILHEERFPEGFETSLRQRFGYTMKEFHMRSFEIYLGMSEPKLPADDVKTEDAIAASGAA